MNKTSVLGLMSGTSLDGLDLALCHFWDDGYEMVATGFVQYNKDWKEKLSSAMDLSPMELLRLDVEYGKWLGEQSRNFLSSKQLSSEWIASHGHTVFHQPDLGYTLQIGSGSHLAAIAGIPVVNDFRSADIAWGGQGAPLVPIGDQLLFSDFAQCLNLGGIANISGTKSGQRIAFDITVANMALNHVAELRGKEYDDGGALARSGTIDMALLDALNTLPFLKLLPPKSLGKEWFNTAILPLLQGSENTPENLLATLCEHIALQCASAMTHLQPGKVLTTGGGAFNQHLIARIQSHTQNDIVVPENKLVQFKEALVFAFLGFLKIQGKINVLASVTGAQKDHSAGSIWPA